MTSTDLTFPLTDRERAVANIGLDSVDETLAVNTQLSGLLNVAYPPADNLAAWQELRASSGFAQATGDHPRLAESTFDGVSALVVEPAAGTAPRGTYVHFHGGTWALGTHRSQDQRLLALSEATGLRVVSVGYRRFPEVGLGTVVEDCVIATRGIVHRLAGDGPLTIGGESAGAHLAAVVLQRLRDDDDAALARFRGAVLTYGAFDLAGGTPSRRADRSESHGIDLVAASAGDPYQPWVSPLYGDLTGMPPARFMVGTRDALLDDNRFMAARWELHAPVELDLVAGAVHAFTLVPCPAAAQVRRREHEFLRRVLD